jgi:ABC-2 type transport system ATP-binding protein
MKQRIKLAQALVHDPDLLFLDEPTNGMDPKGRDEMLELIRDLAHNKGINLILSSHLLPDVEFTCDHVVVMHQGERGDAGAHRRAEGPAAACTNSAIKGDRAGVQPGAGRRGLRRCTRATRMSCGSSCPTSAAPGALFALAAEHRVQVRHLRPSLPTLEDVFAQAVGEE